ncbi:MAG TPA: hypothetical protein VFD92_07025 [Candidatus Binatia bacterium]|nr:hypothetical protein [Candidatus Binatia bacterium]
MKLALVVVTLGCGVVAAAESGVVAAVDAVRAGSASPQMIRIVYDEEDPPTRTIAIAVGNDGTATITTSIVKRDCPRPSFADCWDRTVRTTQLGSEAHRRLVAAVDARGLAKLPHEAAVAPGAARVSLTIDAGTAGRLDVRCSRDTAERAPTFARLRDDLLALGAGANRSP